MTNQREETERWKHHFGEHLNGAENADIEDPGSGINGYGSMADAHCFQRFNFVVTIILDMKS